MGAPTTPLLPPSMRNTHHFWLLKIVVSLHNGVFFLLITFYTRYLGHRRPNITIAAGATNLKEFNDINLHRNQPYAVDDWGSLHRIDESLNLVQHSSPLFGPGDHHGVLKHLLVDGETLFVVDRLVERVIWKQAGLSTMGFRVYEVEEEPGWRPRESKVGFPLIYSPIVSLGEKAFVLSYDCCFGVRAKEYVGFRENCIGAGF
ncbi:hypothetical protein TIFTF001_002190 [Ficus carica]|uniref:KIB1-4 beta-propeller domain-containing protein n=1 Tax=Ficus carica TaxID=3494 RepID=A0AA87ZLR1_FICCA|nr:hypothetical protein TIFTF001_002190 [Ficus carica]